MTDNIPDGPQGDAFVWFGLTAPSTWTDSQWERILKLIHSVEMENNGGDRVRADEIVRRVAELRAHDRSMNDSGSSSLPTTLALTGFRELVIQLPTNAGRVEDGQV